MVNFNKYKGGVQVKVTKLKDLKFDNEHPNKINEGYVKTGFVNVEESNKSQSLLIIHGDRFFHTSQVLEVEENAGYDLIRTLNSVYKVEPIFEALTGMQEKYSLKID